MTPESIPYIAHEGEVTRLCGIIHKLTAIIILLILLLVGSNVGWMVYESSFEDVVQTIEAEQDGSGPNLVGGGDVTYGTEREDHNEEAGS